MVGWENSDGGAAGIYSGAAAGDLTGKYSWLPAHASRAPEPPHAAVPPRLVVFSSCMPCGAGRIRARVAVRVARGLTMWFSTLGEGGGLPRWIRNLNRVSFSYVGVGGGAVGENCRCEVARRGGNGNAQRTGRDEMKDPETASPVIPVNLTATLHALAFRFPHVATPTPPSSQYAIGRCTRIQLFLEPQAEFRGHDRKAFACRCARFVVLRTQRRGPHHDKARAGRGGTVAVEWTGTYVLLPGGTNGTGDSMRAQPEPTRA